MDIEMNDTIQALLHYSPNDAPWRAQRRVWSSNLCISNHSDFPASGTVSFSMHKYISYHFFNVSLIIKLTFAQSNELVKNSSLTQSLWVWGEAKCSFLNWSKIKGHKVNNLIFQVELMLNHSLPKMFILPSILFFNTIFLLSTTISMIWNQLLVVFYLQILTWLELSTIAF